MGRLLGRWWVLWLQPQHLHFTTRAKMGELLNNEGFTPVEWHGPQAPMPIDLSWTVILLLQRLAPMTDRPWLPPSTGLARLRRRVVWAIGGPLLLVAGLLDHGVTALSGPLKSANLYRVLARLEE